MTKMTDTVNVPADDRAEIAALVADYGGNAAYDAWRRIEVALAAAPKAEPVVSCKNCGTVRGRTNECDCSLHDGSLPEWEEFQPEAPKVEQEPYRSDAMLIDSIFNAGMALEEREAWNRIKGLLRTHPAPASDELHRALSALLISLNHMPYLVAGSAVSYWKQNSLDPAIGYARAALEQHKGPQS